MGRRRKKPKKNKKNKKPKKKPKYTAKTADPHELYQFAVQSPEADVDFIDMVYKQEYRRKPVSLREDFCGTALLCSEWVKRKKDRWAIGIDLDRPTLDWGREHNIGPAGDAGERVTLIEDNVLNVTEPSTDVAVAFNFSYFVFKKRPELLEYFKTVRKSITREGMFIIDLLGGPDAQELVEETYPQDEGFDYVWDQDKFNPIDHSYRCYIHFRFKDGTKLDRAFTYDWRLWSLMELRDLLEEAGFSRTDVWWEGADEDGEGNGEFTKENEVENEQAWVAYVVALP